MSSIATITVYPYPKGIDNTQRNIIVRGTIALSSGNTPGGGYTLNWNGLDEIKAQNLTPFDVDVKSIANPPSGMIYLWNSVTGNLHLFVSADASSDASGPLVEFGGNVPGWVVNDAIEFCAVFSRND